MRTLRGVMFQRAHSQYSFTLPARQRNTACGWRVKFLLDEASPQQVNRHRPHHRGQCQHVDRRPQVGNIERSQRKPTGDVNTRGQRHRPCNRLHPVGQDRNRKERPRKERPRLCGSQCLFRCRRSQRRHAQGRQSRLTHTPPKNLAGHRIRRIKINEHTPKERHGKSTNRS